MKLARTGIEPGTSAYEATMLPLDHRGGHIIVDHGGPVVIILASGSEIRGFKPGQGRCISSKRKESKAVDPMS